MKRIAIIITILTIWCTLTAQTNYTFITHHNVVKDSYNFWVSVPDTYDEKPATCRWCSSCMARACAAPT